MTTRKISLCAAAIVVAILPSACGTAFAGDHRNPNEVVEVGRAANADDDSEDDNEADNAAEDGAAEDGAAEEGEEGAGEDDAVGEDAADDDAAAQEGEQDQNNQDRGNQDRGNGGRDQDRGNQDRGNDGGEQGGEHNDRAENAKGGQEPPPPDGEGGNEDNGGLDVLGVDCTNSQLDPHNGFEIGPACVDTAFGEVASEDQSPSLLITEAPQTVAAGEDFSFTVSTRNLIRDRFLGAADGGYYAESSFLNGDGIQRGHFHSACRILESTDEAPDAAPAPEFFLATQDNGGGAGADEVQINVTGLDTPGTYQCSSWAGDGSHRIPMMQRANQTPAFDSFRVTVQ